VYMIDGCKGACTKGAWLSKYI